MKPPLIVLLFLGFFTSANAQYFNIFTEIHDSVGVDQYHYKVIGFEEFNDSLILHVELIENITDDSIVSHLNRSYDLTDPGSDRTGLTLSEEDNTFEIDLGNFPSSQYFLHIWVTINGVVFNETYHQE